MKMLYINDSALKASYGAGQTFSPASPVPLLRTSESKPLVKHSEGIRSDGMSDDLYEGPKAEHVMKLEDRTESGRQALGTRELVQRDASR